MDANIFIWMLVIVIQWKCSRSLSISDAISEDITFLHKIFPVPPSMRAIIEVDVTFPIRHVRKQDRNPLMGIYTTQNHIDIKRQCTYVAYGQLKNSNLFPRIQLDEADDRPTKFL